MNSRRQLCGCGTLVDKMYELRCELVKKGEAASVASTRNKEIDLWHQGLGHLNISHLKEVIRKEVVRGIKLTGDSNLSFCEGCVEGKVCRRPFKSIREIKSTRKLQLIHSDVCGPMQVESFGGKKYFVTFIDDFSRCCLVYFTRQKSEVFEKFKKFEALTTNQTGLKIGTLRTNNGGEYLTNEFEEYLMSKGIHHELSVPYYKNCYK